MKFFKSLLMAVFVLILSFGIFFLLVKDQKIKTDIFRSTLELFGDDLMAMVPDGEQKELLKRKYDEFLQQADKEEIPPEEVERVAATILNLTTGDTVIHAEDALTALNFDNKDLVLPPQKPFEAPEPAAVGKGKKDKTGKWPVPGPPKEYWNDLERRQIAERLSKVKEFQEEMHELIQHDSSKRALRKQMIFNADSGLTVALNVDLKNIMDFTKDTTLQNQIERLEKEKILVWKATLSHQAELEKAINIVLEQIPKIPVYVPDVQHILDNAGLPDSLEKNWNWNFNADSLQKIIEEKIRKAEENSSDAWEQ
ncbi:hypothetical protein JXQ31_19050 [candidate division KSB1 bacterium]|nr:hypothetical protein [candidate division KSB1 bacterium]